MATQSQNSGGGGPLFEQARLFGKKRYLFILSALDNSQNQVKWDVVKHGLSVNSCRKTRNK